MAPITPMEAEWEGEGGRQADLDVFPSTSCSFAGVFLVFAGNSRGRVARV